MRRDQLTVGHTYIAGDPDRREPVSRLAADRPEHCVIVTVIDLAAPFPDDGAGIRIHTRSWINAQRVRALPVGERPKGVLLTVHAMNRYTSPRTVWTDNAGWLINPYVNARQQWSRTAGRHLAALIAETGGPLAGYSLAARVVPDRTALPSAPWEPLDGTPLTEVTVHEVNVPRPDGVDVLDPTVLDPHGALPESGAVVTDRTGRRLWVPDQHHLLPGHHARVRARRDTATATALHERLGQLCEQHAMDLELGRWAPSGNRYHDDAAYKDTPTSELPADAAWLTFRAQYGNHGVVEVGIEALIALLTQPADQQARFAERLAGLLTGGSEPG